LYRLCLLSYSFIFCNNPAFWGAILRKSCPFVIRQNVAENQKSFLFSSSSYDAKMGLSQVIVPFYILV
jgi:hypothetical protein